MKPAAQVSEYPAVIEPVPASRRRDLRKVLHDIAREQQPDTHRGGFGHGAQFGDVDSVLRQQAAAASKQRTVRIVAVAAGLVGVVLVGVLIYALVTSMTSGAKSILFIRQANIDRQTRM